MGRNVFLTVTSGSVGLLAGVVLDAIIIGIFGMGKQTDAYYIANTIPMAIITILMLQATKVILPIFIRARQESETAGWNCLNLVMTTGTVILVGVCVIGVILSPIFMKIQAVSIASEETQIATQLSVFLFCFLPLYVPIVIMRAALNAFDVYGLPGAMKFFENIFKMVFIFLLGKKLGVQALSVGMFASALWQLLIYYVVLRRSGFQFRPSLGLKHPSMIEVYRLVSFQLTAQICDAGVQVLNNVLGSMLGAGSVTALRLASRVIESFAGLLGGSIVLAAMPTIAASAARGHIDATKRNLQRGIELLLMVNIPLAVWLALMSRELIAFLYQRASFSASDTSLVSSLLISMTPILVFGRMRSMFELPFFAEQNTRTPLVATIIEAVVYAASSLLLVHPLGIYGVSIGRVVAAFISAVFLGYLLRRRAGKLGFRRVGASAMKILAASTAMGVCVMIGSLLVSTMPLRGFAIHVMELGVPSVSGFIALLVSMVAIGILDLSKLEAIPALRGVWLTRLVLWTKPAAKTSVNAE